jgi:hypothetical protein
VTIQTSNEISAREHALHGRDAHKSLDGFTHPTSLSKKALVKGRFVGGRMHWDVFDVTSLVPRYIVGGFYFFGEAIEAAGNYVKGRVSVGFKGIFQTFKPTAGLAKPFREVADPSKRDFKVLKSAEGVIVTPT